MASRKGCKKGPRVTPFPDGMGEVELIDWLGSDLTVVNAARSSHGKRKEKLDAADPRLIRFLASNKHYSPFRHGVVQMRFKMPEVVARQFYKHVVGIAITSADRCVDHAWNEISQRYVKVEEAWVPRAFRHPPEGNIKQGSGDALSGAKRAALLRETQNAITASVKAYRKLLEMGLCQEQARFVLPLTVFTEFWWTASLQAIANFLMLRLDSHAQVEIQWVAEAVQKALCENWLFPVSLEALMQDWRAVP